MSDELPLTVTEADCTTKSNSNSDSSIADVINLFSDLSNWLTNASILSIAFMLNIAVQISLRSEKETYIEFLLFSLIMMGLSVSWGTLHKLIRALSQIYTADYLSSKGIELPDFLSDKSNLRIIPIYQSAAFLVGLLSFTFYILRFLNNLFLYQVIALFILVLVLFAQSLTGLLLIFPRYNRTKVLLTFTIGTPLIFALEWPNIVDDISSKNAVYLLLSIESILLSWSLIKLSKDLAPWVTRKISENMGLKHEQE